MKAATILLFISLLYAIKSTLQGFNNKWCTDYENNQNEDYQAFSKDFCDTLALEDSQNKCCYVKYKKNNGTYYNCVELTPSQFYNIKDLKKAFETNNGCDVKTIECESSSYLYGSILLIFILLF